jgi:hypothetical protein
MSSSNAQSRFDRKEGYAFYVVILVLREENAEANPLSAL